MSNRNFSGQTIIQRLQNQVYARNLYKNNTTGQTLINNPQTSDGNASRYNSYIPGAQTEYFRGLVGGGETVSVGGIVNIPPYPPPDIQLTVPGAPTGVSAVAGNGQVTVSFIAPGSDGGSPITEYTVTSSPGGFIASGLSSPITVTGLTNGTPYTFTVVATNAIGNSVPSAASTAVTPATVPGAPTGVSAVRGNAQATVSFTAPVNTGGSTITGYTVTSSPGGITATGSSSPITVTGLTNGTPYTFTVVATNAIGNSVPSTASSPVTPATVPGAPTGVSAVAGNQEATVSFTAPVNTGGSAITGYTVTSSPGGITATGSSSPITVTGLTNGTPYTFTVVATNAIGNSDPSTASSPVTPILAIVTNGLTLYYNFGDPASYSGSGTSVTNLGSVTNTGTLVNGPVFSSANEGILTFDGSNDYIDANAFFSSESFTINSWFKTSSVGVIPRMLISKEQSAGWPWNYRMYLDQTTGYLIGDIAITNTNFSAIAYNTNLADNVWHCTTFSRDATTKIMKVYVDGVLRNTVSDTLVGSIINSQNVWIGRSAFTPPGSYPFNGNIGSTFIYDRALTNTEVTTNYDATKARFLVPYAPTITSITPGNAQLTVNFTAGNQGGSAITNYQYSLNGGSFTSVTPSTPTSIIITGLSNGTSYSVIIRAVNSFGNGVSSNAVSGTPAAPVTVPGAPTITGITGANQKLIVNFTAPTSDGGSPITNYKYSTDGINYTFAGTTTSPITISGLSNGTLYSVTIKAVNSIGDSDPSNSVNGTPNATITSFTTVGTTTWTAPTGITSVEYLVVGGGGGGGGGYDGGGGGGGGGGLALTGTLSVTPGTAYNVSVGTGGTGGTGTTGTGDTSGTDGTASLFSSISAAGGGGGGGSLNDRLGGGGSIGNSGTLTAPTGGKGGRGTSGVSYAGGGGGGMGAAGANSPTSSINANQPLSGGAGGAGVSNNISGLPVPPIYGAGGAGGSRLITNASGNPGVPNTGNGGGGASTNFAAGRAGGLGGSGIVIIKY